MTKRIILSTVLFAAIYCRPEAVYGEETRLAPGRRLMDEVYAVDSAELNESESLDRISGDIDTSFYTGISKDSSVNRALSSMLGSSGDTEISTGY